MSQLNSFDDAWDLDVAAENGLEEVSADSVEAAVSLPYHRNRTNRSQTRRLIEQHLEDKRLRAGLCEVFDEAQDDYQVS